MADGEVNVKVKITSDTKGAQEAEKSIEKAGKASQKTAKQATGVFGKIVNEANRAAGALKKLQSAFMLLGVAAAFNGIIESIKNIGKSSRDATTAAEELAKAEKEAAVKKQIDAATESWKRLADEIQRARTERDRLNELDDENRNASRRMEDAVMRADEAREIEEAGGDADKERLIRNRYASRRTALEARRAIEDFDIERGREEVAAHDKFTSAEAKEKQVSDIDKQIAMLMGMVAQATQRSVSMNEQDGYWESVGENTKRLFTLDWGNYGRRKTSSGDAVRKQAEADRKKYLEQIDELRKQQEQIKNGAEADRKEGEHILKLSAARKASRGALVLEGSTNQIGADREVRSAQKTIDDKTEMHADAITAAENLQREKVAAEQRKAEAEQRRAAAQRAQFEAQSNFDLAKANKGDVGSAAKKLDEAKRNAAAVDRETTAIITSLTETLRNIEGRLKAANNEIRKDQSQAQYAWSQQPAG